jgi:predicted phosphodiesterase
MRVFALSDIHVDYDVNSAWVADLSSSDYTQDVLILAGDVSDSMSELHKCFERFARRFAAVLFVPGNHELWVARDPHHATSTQKFDAVCRIAGEHGLVMQPYRRDSIVIVPLLSWYDYSFGEPSAELLQRWMDYHACVWPGAWAASDITHFFLSRNTLQIDGPAHGNAQTVISFSHFLPRIDLMPGYIPTAKRMIYPVLGTALLDRQIRQLGAQTHIFGHSHVNRQVTIDGVTYVNNAFGYPSETHIARKELLCVVDE